ncbi:MAG: SUMF1/EgtB/PvdO family nonheme iron enzyme [Spirochaetales bacterium]|nr:SUMF1/EgtB/PvdO family nonheme iron enzyme [Spirochaetales bacterium]
MAKIDIPEIEMIPLPAAQFQMGSVHGDADETPVHTVVFTNNILMGKYEITNKQVAAVYTWGLVNGKIKVDTETVVNTAGEEKELIDIDYPDCKFHAADGIFSVMEGYEDHPCTLITWYGAVMFCNLLSETQGRMPVYNPADYSCDWEKDGYRLPTEAEWEFAARGGTESRGFVYSGSNNPDEVAWFSGNGEETTHQVGLKAPNESGFYDMSGNVWECCWDYYGYYIPDIIDYHTFESDLLEKMNHPGRKDYIKQIYIQNKDTRDYELSPELTNEECRKTWEVFRVVGFIMDMRKDPRGIRYRDKRVLRGGDWGSVPFYLRTTYRGRVFAQLSSTGYGFRVVRPDR